MGQLDGLRYTAQHHMLKAPVELTDIAGGKGERYERLLGARAVTVFPVADETLHAVIGTGVALGLQAFEQTAGRSPLTLGQVMVGGKPVAQALLPLPQLRPGLALALIARQVGGVEVFLDGVARQIQVTGNSTDALTLNQPQSADLGDGFHAKHSRWPPEKGAVWHTRGWSKLDAVSPGTWSLLHADLHTKPILSRRKARKSRTFHPSS